MRRTAALFLFLVLGTFCAAQVAQEDSDCPPRTVINNGVCIGENGADCSKQEAQSHVCYDPDPQYTEKAAKPMQIVVEFDFDPHFSSRDAVTAPKCEEVAHRSSSRQ